MKEIKWEDCDDMARTNIHGIYLCCFKYDICVIDETGIYGKWRANVSIRQMAHTMRYGPYRKSLSTAKDDAIRIAKELLVDYYAATVELMSHFDVEQPEKEE